MLSSLSNAGGIVPCNLLPYTFLPPNHLLNKHVQIVASYQGQSDGSEVNPYRLLRLVHELILSGIGPSRQLLATLLQKDIELVLRKHKLLQTQHVKENMTYRSNKSVSFPSSGGICPVSRLSFSSLQRQKRSTLIMNQPEKSIKKSRQLLNNNFAFL